MQNVEFKMRVPAIVLSYFFGLPPYKNELLPPQSITQNPPRNNHPKEGQNYPFVLHYRSQSLRLGVTEKGSIGNSQKVGNRYKHKGIVADSPTPLTVQQTMQRPLSATRRTIPARQQFEPTFGRQRSIGRVETIIQTQETNKQDGTQGCNCDLHVFVMRWQMQSLQ